MRKDEDDPRTDGPETDGPQHFPDHPREELANHPRVGTGSAQGGKCFFLFGLPFAAAGVFMFLASLGQVDVQTSGDAPPWILTAMGLVFGSVGFGMSGAGIRSILREKQLRRDFVRYVDEPWTLDGFHPEYARDLSQGVLAHFGVAAFLALFLSPFNYFAFLSPKREWFLGCFVGVFDLFLVLVFGHACYVLGRRFKYGDGKLRYREFPCLLGRPLRFTLHLPRALQGRLGELRCVLRCVEQGWQRRGDSNQLVTTQTYAEEREIPGGEVEREVSLEFELPKGAPTTELHGDVVRFYELEVGAETPGIDYKAVYLLPVYK
ncbi:MAG: hypothetical protein AB7N76_04740 [Planctomycetota bacterium]